MPESKMIGEHEGDGGTNQSRTQWNNPDRPRKRFSELEIKANSFYLLLVCLGFIAYQPL